MNETLKTAILAAFTASGDTHLIAAAFGIDRSSVETVIADDAFATPYKAVRWTKKEKMAWGA